METIFLKVVKDLVNDKFTAMKTSLQDQISRPFYNVKLSEKQLEIIKELEQKLVKHDSTINDKTDSLKIVKLIQDARIEIRNARVEQGESQDTGSTLQAISKMGDDVTAFYAKLESFGFSLLDRPWQNTPEYILYLHAAKYLGETVFKPLQKSDASVSKTKETDLSKRLEALAKQKNQGFDDQKKWTLVTLEDLDGDNKKIRNGGESSVPIPGANFLGWQFNLSTNLLGPGLGRFKEMIDHARTKIQEMKSSEFKTIDQSFMEQGGDNFSDDSDNPPVVNTENDDQAASTEQAVEAHPTHDESQGASLSRSM